MTGIIIKALSGFYYVSVSGTIYECTARGSFRKSGISPLVGDRVVITAAGDKKAVIDTIEPRKCVLKRPPVANIDKLFIVSSFETPSPSTAIIDRLTAVAVYNSIEPIIVFNKCDMGDFSKWTTIYQNAGFKTLVISALEGYGLEPLRQELKGSICAFTGNSGVGKSSILNALFDRLQIAVGDVSEKLGRGRHTTRHTEMFYHELDGYVIDTPGFSSLESERDDYSFKERLAECFPDFDDYRQSCKFTSCSHTKEKGCGVLNAIAQGEIEPTRHKSYMMIYEELKDLKPWQLQKK